MDGVVKSENAIRKTKYLTAESPDTRQAIRIGEAAEM